MTPLEIRLIAYIVTGLLYTGFVSWGSVTLESHHRDRVEAADKLAQAAQVQVQQAQVIADLKAQQAATVAAENKYETLKNDYAALSSRFDSSLSNYTQVHGQLVSATSTAAALTHAAATGACSDTEVGRLSGEAVKAALSDAAELAGLQTWASGR